MRINTPPPHLQRFIRLSRRDQQAFFTKTLLRVLSTWHRLAVAQVYDQVYDTASPLGRNAAYERFEAHVTSWEFDFWYYENPYCSLPAPNRQAKFPNPYIDEEPDDDSDSSTLRGEELTLLLMISHECMDSTHAFTLNKLLRKSVNLLVEYDDLRAYLIATGEEEL